MRQLMILMMVGALGVFPARLVGAQEPSADQIQLNESAVEAIRAEDYDKAARLLEASLELGELNVTWLNLGRAYQKLGKCAEAKEAYLAVVSAPTVEEPSPKLVDAKAEQYLEELEEECAANNEAAAEKAAENEVKEGDLEEGELEEQAPIAPAKSSNLLGWSATIGGGALLGTSAALFVLGEQEYDTVRSGMGQPNRAEGEAVSGITRQQAIEHKERGDLMHTAALSTAIVGAVVTGLGVYWLVSDDDDTTISVGAGRSDVSVQFSTRF